MHELLDDWKVMGIIGIGDELKAW